MLGASRNAKGRRVRPLAPQTPHEQDGAENKKPSARRDSTLSLSLSLLSVDSFGPSPSRPLFGKKPGVGVSFPCKGNQSKKFGRGSRKAPCVYFAYQRRSENQKKHGWRMRSAVHA
nr:hypothetical protein [Pandoravirus belohorizontensis]